MPATSTRPALGEIASTATVPWRALIVFGMIAIGTTAAIAVVTASFGWTVNAPAWGLLAPIAMWAPALGRLIAQRTVDRGFTSTLPLRQWGVTGAAVILRPLAFPLLVYGVSYVLAWSMGRVHWSPSGGRWTTASQIAINVALNLSLLGVIGTA